MTAPAEPRPNPGDEGPLDVEGVGENLCRRCGGEGKVEGDRCPECNGSGRVAEGIGGG
jgi:hypothetical protein